jgi:hypothetical protein
MAANKATIDMQLHEEQVRWELTVKKQKAELESRTTVLEEVKTNLKIKMDSFDALQRRRSEEVFATAKALSNHHELLLKERHKLARQRLHLCLAMEQIHALALTPFKKTLSLSDTERTTRSCMRLSTRKSTRHSSTNKRRRDYRERDINSRRKWTSTERDDDRI